MIIFASPASMHVFSLSVWPAINTKRNLGLKGLINFAFYHPEGGDRFADGNCWDTAFKSFHESKSTLGMKDLLLIIK